MAKGRSWSAANELYANSDLAKARSQIAELVGTIHRACGLLGLPAGQSHLDAWCKEKEARNRNEEVKRDGQV